jgi:hypothetical protein
MNVGIDRAIEMLNGLAGEATGPTEDGTEETIEGTGALIAEGTIRIDPVRITIRIEGVIEIIKGIIGTTTDTVDIGIHGITIGIAGIDIPGITMDIIEMVNIRKPFSN